MSPPDRIIMHVDMDAFYASIEQRDKPELRGLPVVVGGSGERGVVAAASYEARVFGVRSAMPGREAVRRCPDAIFVRPRLDHYRAVSRQIFEVFHNTTPVVEGLSLDEAFLDVTGLPDIMTRCRVTAELIKKQIHDTTELTASVGVGPNKLIAKIASDLNKPDGLCMLFGKHIHATLDPLPASKLPGVGKKTVERLQRLNIHTIAELRNAPDAALATVFGRYAMRVKQRAAGIDARPVSSARADKSISAENTFSEDLTKPDDMITEMLALADRVAARARKKGVQGAVLAIKVRTNDFTTQTRQMPLKPPSNSSDTVAAQSRSLLREWQAEHPGAAVRLLGVGLHKLREERQLGLFDNPDEETESIDQVLDSIREKYGSSSVKRGNRLN